MGMRSNRGRLYIIPLQRWVDRYTDELEELDEDAAFAVPLRRIVGLMVEDALRQESPDMNEQYERFVSGYESIGLERLEVILIIDNAIDELEIIFNRYRVPLGTHFVFDWQPKTWNLRLWETE